MFGERYDVIVAGGGHAGCEAAVASARMGRRTLLLCMSIDNIALMPCNPSIGGPAKGHLVREVSALGGEQARAADASTLMIRWLNTSKGAAVRALRAQCDPAKYSMYYRNVITSLEHLDVFQDEVVSLIEKKGRITGVKTRLGMSCEAGAVVLCGGVFLGGRVHIGECSFPSGPMGQPPSEMLLSSIEAMGLQIGRMRTDTTPRLNIHTIDLSRAVPQLSSDEPLCFDIWGEKKVYSHSDYACWFSRTTERTYNIIKKNISRSPLVSGGMMSDGPRYCPSIEDKFLRFPDRTSHPIILEPVSPSCNEVYVQNFSTSLPYDVQVEMVHSLPGCENAKIIRPGYGIEYAYIKPDQMLPSMENKLMPGLFCAGQINGTSGYEEAAAQGLLAGINAALSVTGDEPVVLGRSDGYLGVLIDDLTTKSTNEPYRMLTSRCEHRLLMRHDNAPHRLSSIGRRAGLINDARWAALERRWSAEKEEIERLKSVRVVLSPETDAICREFGADMPKEPVSAADFLQRKGVRYRLIEALMPPEVPLGSDEALYVETELRYVGYIERETASARRMEEFDNILLPRGQRGQKFDFDAIPGLSAEGRQKLSRFQPASLGQALRISGVTPADVQLLRVWLHRRSV